MYQMYWYSVFKLIITNYQIKRVHDDSINTKKMVEESEKQGGEIKGRVEITFSSTENELKRL